MKFNRNSLGVGGRIEEPSQELIRNTLGLVNASAEDAIRYGGELTRAALSVMDIKNDRRHVIVDTKVHMLMPGFSPAIPGWHTDGVPRGIGLHALARDKPMLWAQDEISLHHGVTSTKERPLGFSYVGAGATHFHMLVTGDCRTEFVADRNVELEVTEDTKLYTDISHQVEAWKDKLILTPAANQVLHFDWWDLHRGVKAPKHEWRFFIRVTETDLDAPFTDLREVIRTQQQVYAPADFGW